MSRKKGRGRTWILILLSAAVAAAAVYSGKYLVIRSAVLSCTRTMTGLTADVGGISVSLIGTSVRIRDLRLHNPPQFADPLLMVMPEVFIDADMGAYFSKKFVHVESILIDAKEILVTHNEKGELNIDSLVIPLMKIDVFRLKVGRVVLKDYSRGREPNVLAVSVNIDERFEHVTDLKGTFVAAVKKAVMNSSPLALVNFGLKPLKDQVGDHTERAMSHMQAYADKTGGDVHRSTKGALDRAAEKMKDLFRFGKKKKE
jgi:hypothetical protein